MKNLTLLICIACIFGFHSCKKEKDNGPGEIYGTWKLTETWGDPGDGSGKYVKVKGDPKYIIFNQSGNIEGSAIPNITSYKIIDSVKLEVTYTNNPQPIIYRYKVSAKDLELNPPCIEGCGFKFKRK